MASEQDPDKADSLKKQGVLNPHPEKVVDEEFGSSDFFDARDLVQVKYEMLRRVHRQGQTVSGAAQAFGLSRTSFYEAQAALEEYGLPGLLPKRSGPRQAHKLNDEVLDFIEQVLASDDGLRSTDLQELVRKHFDLSVHPRSIERALERRKKKRPGRDTP